jgi:hypothetical protein
VCPLSTSFEWWRITLDQGHPSGLI